MGHPGSAPVPCDGVDAGRFLDYLEQAGERVAALFVLALYLAAVVTRQARAAGRHGMSSGRTNPGEGARALKSKLVGEGPGLTVVV